MENGPFEDVFPIKNGDIPASYVSLPEGTRTSIIHWHLHHPQLNPGSPLVNPGLRSPRAVSPSGDPGWKISRLFWWMCPFSHHTSLKYVEWSGKIPRFYLLKAREKPVNCNRYVWQQTADACNTCWMLLWRPAGKAPAPAPQAYFGSTIWDLYFVVTLASFLSWLVNLPRLTRNKSLIKPH